MAVTVAVGVAVTIAVGVAVAVGTAVTVAVGVAVFGAWLTARGVQAVTVTLSGTSRPTTIDATASGRASRRSGRTVSLPV
jgi:hypothetical protein